MDIRKFEVTYKSSPNIALIKYWGKYDQQYILPINDSLGLTLNQDDFYTITNIKFSKQFSEDSLYLNQTVYPISNRIQKLFRIIRQRAYQKYKALFQEKQWNKYYFNVTSKNSFPTASGMASSASGLACLASALNGLFDNVLNQLQLSQLARLGSGSACRSIHGGLVRWRGVDQQFLINKCPSEQQLMKLSKNCISFSTKKACQLSYMKIICLLATNKQKQTSSTSGMQQSVNTSELIRFRNQITLNRIQRIHQLLNEIQKLRIQKDKKGEYEVFNKVVQVIIKDSNQFHAICLDTYPPIFYLNQFSRMVMNMVDHSINMVDHSISKAGKLKVAYTFDAGPHAFLFVHQDSLLSVFKYFWKTLNIQKQQLNSKGQQLLQNIQNEQIDQIPGCYKGQYFKPYAMWITDVGEGCRKINQQNEKINHIAKIK